MTTIECIPMIYNYLTDWHKSGPNNDQGARLRAAINLHGVHHHMEAYAVIEENGVWKAEHPMFESNINGMYTTGEPDKQFETTEIGGRHYLITVFPYC